MQYVIMIGDETLSLKSIKAIPHDGCISCYDVSENRYCVRFDTDHIFYDYDSVSKSDYSESELEKIPFRIPHFITVIYNNEKRLKTIVQQDNYLRGIYIDNDSDDIVSIEEFIKKGMPM